MKTAIMPEALAKAYTDIRHQLENDLRNTFVAACENNEEEYLQQRTNASESFATTMITLDRVLHHVMTGEDVDAIGWKDDDDVYEF